MTSESGTLWPFESGTHSRKGKKRMTEVDYVYKRRTAEHVLALLVSARRSAEAAAAQARGEEATVGPVVAGVAEDAVKSLTDAINFASSLVDAINQKIEEGAGRD